MSCYVVLCYVMLATHIYWCPLEAYTNVQQSVSAYSNSGATKSNNRRSDKRMDNNSDCCRFWRAPNQFSYCCCSAVTAAVKVFIRCWVANIVTALQPCVNTSVHHQSINIVKATKGCAALINPTAYTCCLTAFVYLSFVMMLLGLANGPFFTSGRSIRIRGRRLINTDFMCSTNEISCCD